jgi:hypothetical protein
MVSSAAQDYERFRWENERERYATLLQDLAGTTATARRAVGVDLSR